MMYFLYLKSEDVFLANASGQNKGTSIKTLSEIIGIQHTLYFPKLCQEEFFALQTLHMACTWQFLKCWLQLKCCPQNVISAKMYLMNRHYINIINVDVLLSIFFKYN